MVSSFESGREPTEKRVEDRSNAPTKTVSPKTPEEPESLGGRSDDELPKWRLVCILLSLAIGLFLAMLDTSIVSTAIYTLSLEFNSLNDAIWVILAYTLTYLAFAVIFARLSDFLGRKSTTLAAYAIFIGFGFGGGFAQNMGQLIACRAIQGSAGSGVYSMTIIIMSELGRGNMVATISSIIGVVIAVAGILGPLVGGLLTHYSSWRWIWWLNAPIGIPCMALLFIALPNNYGQPASRKRSWKEFDYVGSIISLAASVLLVFGLQQAGTGLYSWQSGLIIGTLTTGAVSWLLLFVWEWYIEVHQPHIAGIFPFRIVKNRAMLGGIMQTVLIGYSYLTAIVQLPIRFQIVNLDNPAQAGIHLLPTLCASALGSFIGGAVSKKRNNTFYTFMVAASLLLISTGLLSALPSETAIQARVYGYELLLGFAIGLTLSSISLMTNLEVERRDIAVAQGIVAQARIFGGSIGIAASSALINRHLSDDLVGMLSPEQINDIQTATSLIETFSQQQRQAVQQTYSNAINEAFRICLYLAAFSFLFSLLIYRKNPPFFTGSLPTTTKEPLLSSPAVIAPEAAKEKTVQQVA